MWTHIRREVIHELVTPWPGPEGTFEDHHVHASQDELIGERRGGSARLPPAARIVHRLTIVDHLVQEVQIEPRRRAGQSPGIAASAPAAELLPLAQGVHQTTSVDLD